MQDADETARETNASKPKQQIDIKELIKKQETFKNNL